MGDSSRASGPRDRASGDSTSVPAIGVLRGFSQSFARTAMISTSQFLSRTWRSEYHDCRRSLRQRHLPGSWHTKSVCSRSGNRVNLNCSGGRVFAENGILLFGVATLWSTIISTQEEIPGTCVPLSPDRGVFQENLVSVRLLEWPAWVSNSRRTFAQATQKRVCTRWRQRTCGTRLCVGVVSS